MKYVFTRRFLPLFLTQFFGAANDNFLKNALLILVSYHLSRTEAEAGSISNIAAGLFILPYFLFSSLAGQLADKYDKSSYAKIVKLAEIILMLIAGLGFLWKKLILLLPILFFMGAQSTFFSPAKYALLPTHLKQEELLGGNAWIGGGTYLAILTGSLCGGLIMSVPGGHLWCGVVLILCAIAGFLTSLAIPSAPADDPDLKIDWNLFRTTMEILRDAVWRQPVVRSCIISSSVFWMAGSLYITQMPIFTKHILGGGELVCTYFFILFSIGVGIGAIGANFLFRNRDQIGRYAAGAVFLMGILTLDLAVCAWTGKGIQSEGIERNPLFYRTSFDLLCIAVCGGVWSVPLQALMQSEAKHEMLARTIAGNNIVNSFAMTFGAVLTAVMMFFGWGTGAVFAGLTVVLTLCAIYTFGIRKPSIRKSL